MKRQLFLKQSLATVLGLSSWQLFAKSNSENISNFSMEAVLNEATVFTLPSLPYQTDALEPHFDKQTMEIHHGRHHKAYVDNLNKAIIGTKFENSTLADIMKVGIKLPAMIRNNGGGHWNHSFFWESLNAKTSSPTGTLADAINAAFGSFDKFKEEFAKAATTRFGSGWAWLVLKDGKLAIGSTPNQDNPLMKGADINGTPILGLDVWEHAYYLKYQNKRAEYIKAFWNIVDWNKVGERFASK
jgi:superoxide dismutase, Fe-Mn family